LRTALQLCGAFSFSCYTQKRSQKHKFTTKRGSMASFVHPSGINQESVDKVTGRRGRLHAFETLDPITTALVVIDLDMGTVKTGTAGTPQMASRVNALAATLRQHGGTVAWVTTPIHRASSTFRAVFGDAATASYEDQARSGQSEAIWTALKTQEQDVYASKQGHSAFFPGKTDLHEQLQARNIRSLIIVGTVTNVCCESSARDAYELGYEVTLVSDALNGQSDWQHQATLATFYRCFGDVRPTANVIELITNGAHQ
jgi:nicotinamidase-related amidase